MTTNWLPVTWAIKQELQFLYPGLPAAELKFISLVFVDLEVKDCDPRETVSPLMSLFWVFWTELVCLRRLCAFNSQTLYKACLQFAAQTGSTSVDTTNYKLHGNFKAGTTADFKLHHSSTGVDRISIKNNFTHDLLSLIDNLFRTISFKTFFFSFQVSTQQLAITLLYSIYIASNLLL